MTTYCVPINKVSMNLKCNIQKYNDWWRCSKKLNLRGDISLKLKQTVAYADDVALLARSPKALHEIFYKLQNEATLVGLNINEDKTKYCICK